MKEVESIKEASEDYNYNELCDLYENKNLKQVKELAVNLLYEYLIKFKTNFEMLDENQEEEIINLQTERDVMSIGSTLKSKIALKILILADGTKNTTDISKILKKSIATISMYTNKLKKENLIETSPEGKIKRKIKGLKINLEALAN